MLPAGTGGLVDPVNWRTMEWLKVRKRVVVRHALVHDTRQSLIIELWHSAWPVRQGTCMQDATVTGHLQMDAMTGGTPKFRTGLNLKPWYLAGFRALNRSTTQCFCAPHRF